MSFQYNDPTQSGTSMAPLQATAVNAQANGVYQPVMQNQSSMLTPQATQMQGLPGGQAGGGFFGKGGGFSTALGAIETLGNLWMSFQQNKMAKESFKFQKGLAEDNQRDARQGYNTALEDRIRARYYTEGKTSGEADSYIDRNKL